MCAGNVVSKNWDTASGGGTAIPVSEADCGGLHPTNTSCASYMFGNDGARSTCRRANTWACSIGGGGGGAGTKPLDTQCSSYLNIQSPPSPYMWRGGDGMLIPITGDPYYWAGGGGGSLNLKWNTYENTYHSILGGKGGGGDGSNRYHSPEKTESHRLTYLSDDSYWGAVSKGQPYFENYYDENGTMYTNELNDALLTPWVGGGDAVPNTGSGGGASNRNDYRSGHGGSGIVIMRYSTANSAGESVKFADVTCPGPLHVCKPGVAPHTCSVGEYFLNNTCQTCDAATTGDCAVGETFDGGCYDDVNGFCLKCNPTSSQYCTGYHLTLNACTHIYTRIHIDTYTHTHTLRHVSNYARPTLGI